MIMPITITQAIPTKDMTTQIMMIMITTMPDTITQGMTTQKQMLLWSLLPPRRCKVQNQAAGGRAARAF